MDGPIVRGHAAAIAGYLKPVALGLRHVIAEQGDFVTDVYFVTSGVVSRAGMTSDGRSVELACTGNEGAVGVASHT